MVVYQLRMKSSIGVRDYNKNYLSMCVNEGGRVYSVDGGNIRGDKGGSNKG